VSCKARPQIISGETGGQETNSDQSKQANKENKTRRDERDCTALMSNEATDTGDIVTIYFKS
jgi:hypothetical protein